LNKREVDWPRQLFIKHGNLFLKLLENRAESTKFEVDGLVRIFEEFKVPKHSRILDVSCGIGRHSIMLAERGYGVLGLDLSPLFIAKANTTAKARRVSARAKFRVADVRGIANVLGREKPFEVILNLWSSHGYYGEDEDVRFVHRSQKPDSQKWDTSRRYDQSGLSDTQPAGGNRRYHW